MLRKLNGQLQNLPTLLLTQIADVLTLAGTPSRADLAPARSLYLDADETLIEGIRTNLNFVRRLREIATPPERRDRRSLRRD